MAYIHPLAVEHHRKRWTRPDAYRFAAPGTPEAKMPGYLHPWAAVARAEEAKAAAEQAERDAFEREVLRLRWELKKLKLELELRRFQRKYSPDQPRVPAGNPDGGQWTDGGGEGAGRDTPSTDFSSQARRGGPPRGGTPQQQLRLDLATARAQEALSRVQQLQPDWRPTPSFTARDTVEGLIRAKEAEAREADARFIALSRAGEDAPYATRSAPTTAEVLRPGGQLIGARDLDVTARNVRILSPEEFEAVRTTLMANARRIDPGARYDGVWYDREDGTRFGLRLSVDHGLTLEVIKGGYYLPANLKFHQ
jgi:hypothetical protein